MGPSGFLALTLYTGTERVYHALQDITGSHVRRHFPIHLLIGR